MRLRSSEGWKVKSKPASSIDCGEPCHHERCLDAAVVAQRQFFDEQLIEGLDCIDLTLLDPPHGGVLSLITSEPT